MTTEPSTARPGQRRQYDHATRTWHPALTHTDGLVLTHLQAIAPQSATAREVADALRLSQSGAARCLRVLAEEGYIVVHVGRPSAYEAARERPGGGGRTVTAEVVVVEYDAAPALPSDRRWVMRKVLPPYDGEGFVIGEAFRSSLYLARRLADWLNARDGRQPTTP